jgi:CHAD domain-containing protein
MAQKSAERKQQDTSQPALTHLTATADAFNAAVAQCAQDSDPDAVHRVRTGSRRLQAMLEARLRETPGPALEQPARAWLRQLKQIRRAAGVVRDLDVHRKLLEDWVGKDSGPLSKQSEMLDAWLKGERKRLAHGMQKKTRKRQPALAEGQAGFLAAMSHSPLSSMRGSRPADVVALEDFVRAADTMPVLDAENLHDFRKATKKARYVAESAVDGQTSNSVAIALKRIQDAIGDWHDWLCLREEASAALGQEAPDLTAFLEREVERHFAAAMKTTQSTRGRLLGEWMASQSPAKRPPGVVRVAQRGLASAF